MTIVFVLHRTLRTMIVIRLFEFQIRRAAAAVTVQLPGVTSPSTRHNIGEVLLISNCDIWANNSHSHGQYVCKTMVYLSLESVP